MQESVVTPIILAVVLNVNSVSSPVNLWIKFKLIATKAYSAKYEASK